MGFQKPAATPALVDEWLAHIKKLNYSPTTLANHRVVVRLFFRAYPNLRLRYLSSEHIERFILRDGISPRSSITNLAILSGFFKYLVKRGVLKENPCKGVERPRYRERIRPAPSWEEFHAIRAACKTLEEEAIVEVFYFTGVRRSELRAIRLSDVNFTQRRIRVLGKGGKERVVVFPERVVTALRRYVDSTQPFRKGPADYLFPAVGPQAGSGLLWRWAEHCYPGVTREMLGKEPARPVGYQFIQRFLWRIGKDIGLPYRLTPHILRHGYFRLLKVRGVPLEMASRLGGHENISTTARIYGRLSDDDLQNAYDRALSSGSDA